MKKIFTFFAAMMLCSFMGVSAKVYYITGNDALVPGNAWQADALKMSGDSTHTFQAMAAGTYEMKITDGQWGDGHEWSFDNVDVANSSAGIKSKGSNHNIGFTVETPNNVVVSIANGVITITGTFKVDQPQPAGEKAYYIKNNWNGGSWEWQQMTPNTDSTEWTYTGVYGGTGVNIADNAEGTDAAWFEQNNIAGNPTSGNEYTFTYNVSDKTVSVDGGTPGPGPGPQPGGDVKYYIKNCWNGGDWTWQEMTPNADSTEWTYTDTFGGTGVNINTKADDSGAQWFPTDDIAGNPTADIENTFTYNVNDGTVTAVSEGPGPGPGPGPQPGTVDYYLIGYINGADKGCNSDWATLDPDYKFVDGALSMTFTSDSYVYIKTGDNANWYMCAEYVPAAESASATFMTASETVGEKLGVPSGVVVNFTLVNNGDGSFILSYTTGVSALGEAMMNAAKAEKMMIDGKLYIVRGGKMYSVLGQE